MASKSRCNEKSSCWRDRLFHFHQPYDLQTSFNDQVLISTVRQPWGNEKVHKLSSTQRLARETTEIYNETGWHATDIAYFKYMMTCKGTPIYHLSHISLSPQRNHTSRSHASSRLLSRLVCGKQKNWSHPAMKSSFHFCCQKMRAWSQPCSLALSQ